MRRRALLGLVVAFVLAGCGGDESDGAGDEQTFEGAQPEKQDPGPIHVHGLGIDPADGSLFIATHTGLYRVAEDEQRARLVGQSRQDTMGFSVAGPNRFLGSGHPDLRSDLPPHLGLIESTDAGRTWKPVALLGEADFHVLETAGNRVYGFDATNARLLVSSDRGRTWSERTAPEPLLDLAPHPRRPDTAVAAASVLYRTIDGGRRWVALGGEAGYLAWPRPDRLFQLIAGGLVQLSRDGGERWSPLGSIGGDPAAFLAVSASELYAALHDGTIMVSRNGGETWGVRSRP